MGKKMRKDVDLGDHVIFTVANALVLIALIRVLRVSNSF